MELDKFELSEWEKDILKEFDIDECIDFLMAFVNPEGQEDFLICLADDIFSYRNKVINRDVE